MIYIEILPPFQRDARGNASEHGCIAVLGLRVGCHGDKDDVLSDYWAGSYIRRLKLAVDWLQQKERRTR